MRSEFQDSLAVSTDAAACVAADMRAALEAAPRARRTTRRLREQVARAARDLEAHREEARKHLELAHSAKEETHAEWERRHAEHSEAWEAKHAETTEHWEAKHNETTEHWEAKHAETTEHWEAKHAETHEAWEAKHNEARDAWERAKRDAHDAWVKKHQEEIERHVQAHAEALEAHAEEKDRAHDELHRKHTDALEAHARELDAERTAASEEMAPTAEHLEIVEQHREAHSEEIERHRAEHLEVVEQHREAHRDVSSKLETHKAGSFEDLERGGPWPRRRSTPRARSTRARWTRTARSTRRRWSSTGPSTPRRSRRGASTRRRRARRAHDAARRARGGAGEAPRLGLEKARLVAVAAAAGDDFARKLDNERAKRSAERRETDLEALKGELAERAADDRETAVERAVAEEKRAHATHVEAELDAQRSLASAGRRARASRTRRRASSPGAKRRRRPRRDAGGVARVGPPRGGRGRGGSARRVVVVALDREKRDGAVALAAANEAWGRKLEDSETGWARRLAGEAEAAARDKDRAVRRTEDVFATKLRDAVSGAALLEPASPPPSPGGRRSRASIVAIDATAKAKLLLQQAKEERDDAQRDLDAAVAFEADRGAKRLDEATRTLEAARGRAPRRAARRAPRTPRRSTTRLVGRVKEEQARAAASLEALAAHGAEDAHGVELRALRESYEARLASAESRRSVDVARALESGERAGRLAAVDGAPDRGAEALRAVEAESRRREDRAQLEHAHAQALRELRTAHEADLAAADKARRDALDERAPDAEVAAAVRRSEDAFADKLRAVVTKGAAPDASSQRRRPSRARPSSSRPSRTPSRRTSRPPRDRDDAERARADDLRAAEQRGADRAAAAGMATLKDADDERALADARREGAELERKKRDAAVAAAEADADRRARRRVDFERRLGDAAVERETLGDQVSKLRRDLDFERRAAAERSGDDDLKAVVDGLRRDLAEARAAEPEPTARPRSGSGALKVFGSFDDDDEPPSSESRTVARLRSDLAARRDLEAATKIPAARVAAPDSAVVAQLHRHVDESRRDYEAKSKECEALKRSRATTNGASTRRSGAGRGAAAAAPADESRVLARLRGDLEEANRELAATRADLEDAEARSTSKPSRRRSSVIVDESTDLEDARADLEDAERRGAAAPAPQRRRSSVIVSESSEVAKLRAPLDVARGDYEAARRDAEAAKRSAAEDARAGARAVEGREGDEALRRELEDAKRDLEDARRALDDAPPPAADDGDVDGDVERLRDDLAAAADDRDALRRDLDALKQSANDDAKRLRGEARDAKKAADDARRANEADAQEQRFTREVDGLQRDLAARDEESDVVAQLRSEIADLTADLEATRADLEDLEQHHGLAVAPPQRRRSSVIVSESQVVSKLKADAELEDARRDAARDAAEVARLTRDLDVARDGARSVRDADDAVLRLQSDLDDALRDLDEARRDLADASKQKTLVPEDGGGYATAALKRELAELELRDAQRELGDARGGGPGAAREADVEELAAELEAKDVAKESRVSTLRAELDDATRDLAECRQDLEDAERRSPASRPRRSSTVIVEESTVVAKLRSALEARGAYEDLKRDHEAAASARHDAERALKAELKASRAAKDDATTTPRRRRRADLAAARERSEESATLAALRARDAKRDLEDARRDLEDAELHRAPDAPRARRSSTVIVEESAVVARLRGPRRRRDFEAVKAELEGARKTTYRESRASKAQLEEARRALDDLKRASAEEARRLRHDLDGPRRPRGVSRRHAESRADLQASHRYKAEVEAELGRAVDLGRRRDAELAALTRSGRRTATGARAARSASRSCARSVEGHTAALAKLNADLVQKCEALMRKSKRPRAPRDFDAY
ncbi:hypothetical protein JL720_4758 [Aureococcus anophagefferens]|nr:hypothetical protein JL720_4758 [Aureococcus anophagefferens]